MAGVTEGRCERLTADEAALYDRQIRLWGLEAQNRMRSAHVVVVTLSGVATEIIKNVVLAGIGRLSIVDAGDVQADDLSASFFFTGEDVGHPRISDAPLQRIRKLNPHVDVQGISASGADARTTVAALQPSVVVVTSGMRATLEAWNDMCRDVHAMFFASVAQGLGGYVFCDLEHFTYAVERTVPGEQEKRAMRYAQEFVPLREAVTAPWRFRPSPGLVATLAQWALAEVPDSVEAYEAELVAQAQSLLASRNVKQATVFRRQDAASFYQRFARATYASAKHDSAAAFAPTSAVLGGLAAQAILNALGQREDPIVNWCVADISAGTADVHAMGPTSLDAPTAL